MTETPLEGGGRTKVSRNGDVVLREGGAWASTVHALLRHLEAVGFTGAPRVVGSGFDEQGRETLSFVEGEVTHLQPWSEDALPHLGRLLRDLHRATETFVVPADAVWRPWHGRPSGGLELGIGHCDAGPWNIVGEGGASSCSDRLGGRRPCGPDRRSGAGVLVERSVARRRCGRSAGTRHVGSTRSTPEVDRRWVRIASSETSGVRRQNDRICGTGRRKRSDRGGGHP